LVCDGWKKAPPREFRAGRQLCFLVRRGVKRRGRDARLMKRHRRPNIWPNTRLIRFFRRVGALPRDSTHVPTPNSHRIVSTTFGDDHLGSIGGKLGDFRFRLRSLTVTKTAQALKLRHPTNRTNLMAVLLPYRSPSLTHGCDGSSRNQE
jgi:hypothetical protein